MIAAAGDCCSRVAAGAGGCWSRCLLQQVVAAPASANIRCSKHLLQQTSAAATTLLFMCFVSLKEREIIYIIMRLAGLLFNFRQGSSYRIYGGSHTDVYTRNQGFRV